MIDELGKRFAAAGEELALVGGPVRDAMLGRLQNDLDFTTSARPEKTEKLLAGWVDAIWDMGRAFGTIGARIGDWQVEITTYRAETYDPSSRKPDVAYGDNLPGDLGRRDFTVNAMAVSVPGREFEDPYGGLVDLANRTLRTPGSPRGLLLRRPAADDAGRALRRPAGLHGRARGDRGDDRDGRPDRDHLRRAGPRRAGQARVRTVPAARADAPGGDRPGGVRPARAAGARPRARRAPPPQGRLRAHADGARAVDRPRVPARRRAPTSSPASPR